MDFQKLRLKHRDIIVRHASRLCGLRSASALQQQAIDRFFYDGNLQALLKALKNPGAAQLNSDLPSFTVQEGTGTIRVCESNLTFSAGGTCQVWVEVENLSHIVWKTDEQTPIFLSYHWYTENCDLCELNGSRTPLAHPIFPGETKQLALNIQSLSNVGNYLLEVTMVMEGKFWFEERGLHTRREPAKITPPQLPPHVNLIFRSLIAAFEKRKQVAV